MFERLPFITKTTLDRFLSEGLAALLADLETPLQNVRKDNPHLYRAIQIAAQSIARDIGDGESTEQLVTDLFASLFIVLRLIDLALGSEFKLIDAALQRQRLHTAIGENRETN